MKWSISRPFQVRKVHKSVGNGAAQREQSQDFLYSAEPASHHEATLCNGAAQRRRGMKASVNLQLSSFATRHRLSKLISALGLASVATAEASASSRSVKFSCTLPSEQAIMPA